MLTRDELKVAVKGMTVQELSETTASIHALLRTTTMPTRIDRLNEQLEVIGREYLSRR